MKSPAKIIETAQNTLKTEVEGISELIPRINDEFAVIVNTILKIKGRVIITGIGKSAIIAQKIVATFNSTGTPAIFMHAGDAIHGDLGIIQRDDLVICISKSGDTPEIKVLVPFLKQSDNILIGMTGNLNSYLAQQADHVLDTTVKKEACPHNLAPTSSTTAQLVLGDALAVCLLECREFSSSDFAKYHPGGALGKRLYLRVKDLSSLHEKPWVAPFTPMNEVLIEITKNRLGAVAVIENEQIKGVITDGDVRRILEKHSTIEGLKADDVMGKNPRKIDQDELATNALEIMRQHNINQLLVVENEKYTGIIHLHDLLKEGII